ncbi:MAG TPA: 2-amino-4-hydroxy-6-hydroxymethyldihydropteridine pyrophosphokinase [Synergistaceae bacterium]|nr:2-amino-4-hydroxy-6-hydroxymethyldihydropteridine pyrophosphokinase [Synergistaceae bacterium]
MPIEERSLHTVYLLLGANLGDRQSNILQALQYLQGRAYIEDVSSFYETEPEGIKDQPSFLNLACRLRTDMEPQVMLRFVKSIELRMGRVDASRNLPRPIDVDILLYDSISLRTDNLTIPHSRLADRPFALVPLAEIAPDLVPPGFSQSIGELAEAMDISGIRKVEKSLRFKLERDIQQSSPSFPLVLSRVGVTNLRRIIRMTDHGRESLFYADMDLFAYLDQKQAGVHMSRFSDVLERLTEEISLEPSSTIEGVAERLARQIATTQRTERSEVFIRAKYPLKKLTPLSGRSVEEIYTFIGIASCSGEKVRTVTGVEVEGMTVCPCAQDMVRSHSKKLLVEDGFSDSEADRILGLIPLASHNQRGRGTLLIGGDWPVRAEHLVHVLEASMSSETYELLKRSDEFFIVNKAHHKPMFTEDVVREVFRNLIDIYPDLPDETFVMVKQENLESIHQHNAFAERSGTMGAIREELMNDVPSVERITLQEWLQS